jgi:hypothetical protein
MNATRVGGWHSFTWGGLFQYRDFLPKNNKKRYGCNGLYEPEYRYCKASDWQYLVEGYDFTWDYLQMQQYESWLHRLFAVEI